MQQQIQLMDFLRDRFIEACTTDGCKVLGKVIRATTPEITSIDNFITFVQQYLSENYCIGMGGSGRIRLRDNTTLALPQPGGQFEQKFMPLTLGRHPDEGAAMNPFPVYGIGDKRPNNMPPLPGQE